MIEIWVPISETDGKYSVSNFGQVRSNPGKTSQKNGILKSRKGRVLKKHGPPGRYLMVTYFIGSSKVSRTVHRLVAAAFCPRGAGKDFVNHIDGNKTNNHSENLEWTTPSENQHHSAKNRLARVGEDHHRSKVTEKEVSIIRRLHFEGKTQSELSKIYKMRQSSISRIIRGDSYKCVPMIKI